MFTHVQDINGIAYAPLSQLDSSIKVLSIDGIMPTTQTIGDQVYPLRSTIFIVGPEEPSAPLAAFVSWVQSEDGQATVSQKYIPLID